MSDEDNIEIIKQFWQHFGKQDYNAAADLLHKDFVWWVGLAEELPGFKNPQNKQDFIAFHVDIENSNLPNGVNLKIKEIWASENNRVVLEATSTAVNRLGRDYSNVYALFFELSDGKIVRMHEYADTAYSHAIHRA